MTTIECTECETVFDASSFGPKYAADMCSCGNLQILVKEVHAPVRITHLTTIKYKRTEPKIVEVLTEKKEVVEEKVKKFGFSSD